MVSSVDRKWIDIRRSPTRGSPSNQAPIARRTVLAPPSQPVTYAPVRTTGSPVVVSVPCTVTPSAAWGEPVTRLPRCTRTLGSRASSSARIGSR